MWPEGRVQGARVQGALGTVGTARAGGKRPAGLPLQGGGVAVGASQNGKDTVFPLGWSGGGGDRDG